MHHFILVLSIITTFAWQPLLVRQAQRWWKRNRPESAAFFTSHLILAAVSSLPLWSGKLPTAQWTWVWDALACSSSICCLLHYVTYYVGGKIPDEEGES
jgi:hypothetical protein